MKKLVKAMALLLALVLCLSVTVLAAEEAVPDASNELAKIYAEEGVIVSFVDSEKINVSCEAYESGFFLVVVKLDDGKNPNEDNIIYIDQAVSADGAVEFNVYASKTPGSIEDCIIMAYGPGFGEGKLLATVEGAVKVGDVNGDDKITSADLIRLAKYIANKNSVEISSTKAADANGDGKVSSADLIRLAKYIANKNSVTLG